MNSVCVEYHKEYFSVQDLLAEPLVLTKVYYNREGRHITTCNTDKEMCMSRARFTKLYNNGVVRAL